MDPHLSSTPTPEPHGHMLPYYRRHNYYLIAIICKKNQTDIITLEGRSAAHKTRSFLPIPNTWDLNRRPRRWPPRPNHLTKWPQTRWCTTRDLALSIKKNPSPNGHSFRYVVLCTKKSVTNIRTPKINTPPKAKKKNLRVKERFATSHVVGDYSREAPVYASPYASPAGVLPDGLGGVFLLVVMVLISRELMYRICRPRKPKDPRTRPKPV
jgi:hypothetical protein